MSDLVKYNEEYVPKGQGFVNLGATCYFNSLLQCILSCPVIYETLLKYKDKSCVQKNRIAQNLMKLWEASLKNEDVSQLCIPIWNDIIQVSKSQNNRVRMDSGQQDAHEGLMMFLDAMETIPYVQQLFLHRHCIQIYCENCKRCVSEKKQLNNVFEVQPDLRVEQLEKFASVDEFYNTTMDLNTFLKKQNGYVDEDYKCPVDTGGCGKKGSKFQVTTLTMIPEILPIVLKKYYKKVNTPFPASLEFITADQKERLVYKLVAQSEHSGGMQGGHYWAIAKRKDGWKNLNDSSVQDGTPMPTKESYVLFYNYVGNIPNSY